MNGSTRGGGTAGARHARPVFEGRASRRHRRDPIWRLRLEAAAGRLSGGFGGVETFVQFAGFPRSGHSLVGSLLDAHPEALIAHELDAMGLVAAGLSEAEIFALIRANSAAFERHGRWWNGYSYAVPGGAGGRAPALRVIGDKKGDWAVRRTREDPGLLDRLAALTPRRRRAWILVLRNPFDNVATMSLRKGRLYDRLRIEAPDREAFRARLAGAQREGGIAAEALEEMVEDYAGLCEGVAALKARTAPQDWMELRHEDLAADPEGEIRRLLDFLGLADRDGFAARTAGLVGRSPRRSRRDVAWPEARRGALEALIARHAFLEGYGFDD